MGINAFGIRWHMLICYFKLFKKIGLYLFTLSYNT